MHKRQIVHHLPPHPDNHDRAAPPHRKRRGADAALDPGALEHRPRRDVLPSRLGAEQRPDRLSVALCAQARVDAVGEAPGHELLGEGEAQGLNIGDDERVGARGAGGGERDEADGAGAADDGAGAQLEAGGADAVQDDGEGFKEGALGVGYVVGEPGRLALSF